HIVDACVDELITLRKPRSAGFRETGRLLENSRTNEAMQLFVSLAFLPQQAQRLLRILHGIRITRGLGSLMSLLQRRDRDGLPPRRERIDDRDVLGSLGIRQEIDEGTELGVFDCRHEDGRHICRLLLYLGGYPKSAALCFRPQLGFRDTTQSRTTRGVLQCFRRENTERGLLGKTGNEG